MIAVLRGVLQLREEDAVIVDVNGVGFYVHVPAPVMNDLGREGSDVSLYTHLHVRENELSLYGFSTIDQRALFQKLLTVSGIGPRVALALLSALTPDQLRMAIAEGNVSLLTRAPGVGKRTAERMILDLKGKIDLGELVPAGEISMTDAEVIAALESLGYSRSEAQEAMRHLPDGDLSLEEKITEALRYFAS
ncbi:MAG: Holliday junction branch migration protein RuvA [Anaerolineae bacterium]